MVFCVVLVLLLAHNHILTIYILRNLEIKRKITTYKSLVFLFSFIYQKQILKRTLAFTHSSTYAYTLAHAISLFYLNAFAVVQYGRIRQLSLWLLWLSFHYDRQSTECNQMKAKKVNKKLKRNIVFFFAYHKFAIRLRRADSIPIIWYCAFIISILSI